MFIVAILCLSTWAYYQINDKYRDNTDLDCEQHLKNCQDLQIYNYILTIYMIIIIAKNIAMSLILFLSLYRFYKGLKRIGL